MSARMVYLSITETQLGKLQAGSVILQDEPKKSDVLAGDTLFLHGRCNFSMNIDHFS
jgi:hypothetical protein